MSGPRVSIIIPTHNRAALLPRAVASAQRAGGDPEIIVVDDASTDGTSEICRTLGDVRVVRLKRNLGLAGARNAGIRESTGDYIALLDDDDQRLPDSLPAQIAALEANREAALCYGQVFIGDSQTGESTGELAPQELPIGDLFWRLLRGNFIPGLSVVIRRVPLFEIGLFHPQLRQVEDWDLWLRMSERWTFTALERPVAIYRMFERTSRQLSSNRALMALAAARVQRRALQLPRAKSDPVNARTLRRKFLEETRYTLLHETIDALELGAKKPARDNLLAVLQLLPGSLAREEIRELIRLAIGRMPKETRSYQKRLKAARKKLWEIGLPA